MNNDKILQLYEAYSNTIDDMSRSYKIPVPTLLAVIKVETNDDDGFDKDGKLIIRFEIHKFKKYCEKNVWELVQSQFQYDAKEIWKGHKFRLFNEDEFKRFHGNQFNEHFVFNICREMDDRAAHMCISMGLPQIMGFNYNQASYSSPQEMFIDFNIKTDSQLQGMGRFFSTAMRTALKGRKFTQFAKMYNGSGKAVRYGEMLKVAEAKIAASLDF